MCTPYPELVITGIICIEKALKGTEIVYVLTRFYCIVCGQMAQSGLLEKWTIRKSIVDSGFKTMLIIGPRYLEMVLFITH